MAAKQAPHVPPAERVQSSYKQLSTAALSLNSASDELGKAISVLDAALKKLNLGISAWTTLSSDDNGDGSWWSRDIGYTKVRDKWGIAFRSVSGSYQDPDRDAEEVWLFNEAPRWMRTEAVGKIPDLFEALLKRVNDATITIQKSTGRAYDLVAGINAVAGELPGEDSPRAVDR